MKVKWKLTIAEGVVREGIIELDDNYIEEETTVNSREVYIDEMAHKAAMDGVDVKWEIVEEEQGKWMPVTLERG